MGKLILLGATSSPTGPELPHSAGVGGYSHRYIASHIEGTAPASVVSTWTDLMGNHNLFNVAGTPATTYQEEGGVSFVRSTTAASAGGSLWSGANTFVDTPHTVAAVVRTAALNQAVITFGGYKFQRDLSGNWQIRGSAAGITLTGNSNWTLVIAVGNLASSKFRVDALANDAVNLPAASADRHLGFGPAGTPSAAIDVAEIVHWPTALTAGELTDIRTAMMAHYTVLV